jgi:hypothetical protein
MLKEFTAREVTDCTFALIDYLLDEQLQPRPCSTDAGAFRQVLDSNSVCVTTIECVHTYTCC